MIDRRWPRHFVDTETTALETGRGEIIEIAILTEHKPGLIDPWVIRIRPAHIETADPVSLTINGYDPKKWNTAPCFSEVSDNIARRLKYGTVIGHNVQFDLSFIRAALSRCGDPRITHRWICTKQLALEHLPPLHSVSLKNLRVWFNISDVGSHTAGKDAEDCRRVFYKLHRAGAVRRLWWAIRHRWMIRNK